MDTILTDKWFDDKNKKSKPCNLQQADTQTDVRDVLQIWEKILIPLSKNLLFYKLTLCLMNNNSCNEVDKTLVKEMFIVPENKKDGDGKDKDIYPRRLDIMIPESTIPPTNEGGYWKAWVNEMGFEVKKISDWNTDNDKTIAENMQYKFWLWKLQETSFIDPNFPERLQELRENMKTL